MFSCLPMFFLASSGLHPCFCVYPKHPALRPWPPARGPTQPSLRISLRGNLHSRRASQHSHGASCLQDTQTSHVPTWASGHPPEVLPCVSLNSLLLQPAPVSASLRRNWHVLIHVIAFSSREYLLSACHVLDFYRHWGHSSEQDRCKSPCNKQIAHQKQVKKNHFRERMFEANKTGMWDGWWLDGMEARVQILVSLLPSSVLFNLC